MPNYVDYYTSNEIQELIQELRSTCPSIDPNQFSVIHSPKESHAVMRITALEYPLSEWFAKPFIVEVFDNNWGKLSKTEKRNCFLRLIHAFALI